MSETTDYTPIACARYSQLELWIMHRQPLRLSWREADGQRHVARLLPRDLETTAQKEEYLLAADAEGRDYRIRLDRIANVEPLEETPL